MPRELTAVCLGGPRAELGETPRVDSRTGKLLWTDITGGLVHVGGVVGDSFELERTLAVEGMAGPVTPLPGEGAGWVMARESELVHLAQDGTRSVLAEPEANRPTAFNDGVADTEGNLWVGSMSRNGAVGQGRLWRFDSSGHGTVALGGIGISNGLDFTADGRSAYYVDTSARTLRHFDIDPRTGIQGSTTLVSFAPETGDPDGLVVDNDGCIWVALWDGWAVHRYSPKGELLDVVQVPAARPTAVALVGNQLVITSCSGWLDEGWEQESPDAGKLFGVNVAVSGPSARPYRGSLKISLQSDQEKKR
ncbi:SMP-30/gluconolactonase/LRE family protein [Arthrobacter psychrochitiniphilus]|uniref:SMP-30/gluconolactonase/LRE family protein n=1 Tax=Arthrobacter psychrochitiniphilus TaxID=291045 RepID=UPI003F7B7AAD